MLTREKLEKLKHKQSPSMQDVAVLLVTAERLFKINDDQAAELKTCLNSLARLKKQLDWYRQTTIKEIS
tara:strand:+ start:30 stop:236 length:207 start_codon:yes stop_codon:yes gene_type:complete